MALGDKPPLTRLAQMLLDKVSGSFTGEYNGVQVNYHVGAMASAGDPSHMSCDAMWKAQPNLRTVVDFYARNISQLHMHLYERGEDGSTRVHDHAVSALMRKPNKQTTGSEMFESLVSDWALYNEAFIWVRPVDSEVGYELQVIPASWVTRNTTHSLDGPESYSIAWGDGKPPVEVPGDQIVEFKGWTPGDPTKGTSPVHSLRLILEERYAAHNYRNQVWRKSGRMGGTFTRPQDAPKWSDAARRRFMRMAREFTGNSGARAGEDMLLEDGIKYERVSLAAKEEQFVESSKLSLETVAQVYHINPTMIGMLDNANFSNVREFRRGVYGDTLGPVITKLEDRFNEFILPLLGIDNEQYYLEFNVEAKLRGSFEEQAGIISTATGAPWQTRNEARAMFNMPKIEGGDEIVTPLNVLIGGQASPQDGGAATDQTPAPPPGQQEDDDDEEELDEEEKSLDLAPVMDTLVKFLGHQRQSINSRIGAGREDWWDGDRWSKALTRDLVAQGMDLTVAGMVSDQVNARVRDQYEKSGLVTQSIDTLVSLLDNQ